MAYKGIDKINTSIRAYSVWGHQNNLELQVQTTLSYWINLWFNKAMLFPFKLLLWECLSNWDRVLANKKDLLGSWKLRNENVVELHQSGRSIRPVSSNYPIRGRSVRVQCGQLKLILCPLVKGKDTDKNDRLNPVKPGKPNYELTQSNFTFNFIWL